jgi:hypothetical protein
LGLDGYALRTFLTVLEETSVSGAAARLGVSQSAVSHTLAPHQSNQIDLPSQPAISMVDPNRLRLESFSKLITLSTIRLLTNRQ